MSGGRCRMINKDRYFEILERLLKSYYDEIKVKNRASEQRRHYIDGYMKAARTLDCIGYDELWEVIGRVHFEVFGKTIEERRRSELEELSPEDDSLAIPAYVRQGIELDD
jgi:hypothetical protein